MIIGDTQQKDFTINLNCPHEECKKGIEVKVQVTGDKPRVADVEYGISDVKIEKRETQD